VNTRQLLSVGIDIGTTTTQVIFSHLELVNRAAVSQVPRYEFIKREISWQSPVFFTPVDKQGGLKEAELKSLILEQYQAAGIAPESVDSGAIIITDVRHDEADGYPRQSHQLRLRRFRCFRPGRPLRLRRCQHERHDLPDDCRQVDRRRNGDWRGDDAGAKRRRDRD
jgi:hypothetical protein